MVGTYGAPKNYKAKRQNKSAMTKDTVRKQAIELFLDNLYLVFAVCNSLANTAANLSACSNFLTLLDIDIVLLKPSNQLVKLS